MNKELKNENLENLEAENKSVISKLQNLRKEIKAPHEAYLKVIAEISSFSDIPQQKPVPQKQKILSPFFISNFFKLSVPVLALMLIIGFSAKNNFEEKRATFVFQNEEPTAESFDSLAMMAPSGEDTPPEDSTASTAMMKTSPAPEEQNAESLENITESEFRSYESARDDHYAQYDEDQMINFVNYYDENF